MTDLIHDTSRPMARLREIMRHLRDPDRGCPWDIEQSFDTIAPYTIEEAYEVADAIQRRDWHELEGELGDLLLQTVYHAQMGQEEGHFTFDSIANAISDKMIWRHPHVFGSESRDKSAKQQTADWEKIKADERSRKATGATLEGVAMGLPGLTRAVKLQKRMARVGFDWDDATGVLDKITEETRELVEASNTADADAMEDEFGDLLFALANLARHFDIDPEAAIRRTNAKVTRRFVEIEARLKSRGQTPAGASLDEMETLWGEIKKEENL